MRTHRQLVASAVLLASVAATGCSAEMFTQVNTSLKSVSTATKAVGSGRMSTAVLATAIGGFTVVQAMSNKQQAGLIAAGGGNYKLTQWSDDLLNTPITAPIQGNSNVKGDVSYTSVIDGGSLVSTLTVKGAEASGYTMDLAGKFTYSTSGRAAAELTGKLSRTKAQSATDEAVTLEIEKLSFAIDNPMPDSVKNFGGLNLTYMEGSEKQKLAIELSREGGKMKGSASIYQGKDFKTKLAHRYEFSEDNPAFTETTEAAADL